MGPRLPHPAPRLPDTRLYHSATTRREKVLSARTTGSVSSSAPQGTPFPTLTTKSRISSHRQLCVLTMGKRRQRCSSVSRPAPGRGSDAKLLAIGTSLTKRCRRRGVSPRTVDHYIAGTVRTRRTHKTRSRLKTLHASLCSRLAVEQAPSVAEPTYCR